MAKVLAYISNEIIIDGHKYYEIEPLISGTGIIDDEFEFTGSVFALDDRGIRALGERSILPALFDRRGLLWRVEGGDLPTAPVFITDDEHQVVLLNEAVQLTFSPDFVRSPPGPSGVVLTGSVLNQFGLIFQVNDRSPKENRITVIGKDCQIPDAFEVRSIREPEYVVAWARVLNRR